MELEKGEYNYFNRINSKKKNDAMGLSTGDIVDHTEFYEQAGMMAPIPFKSLEFYSKES